AVDQTGEDTAEGLNTQGEGSDVKQEKIVDLAGQDGTLDGGTHGDSLIGVDGLGGVTAEDGLDSLRDLGHTGHTTDKDDLLDLLGLEAGILESLAHGLDSLVDQGVNNLLELSTGELGAEVLGAGS